MRTAGIVLLLAALPAAAQVAARPVASVASIDQPPLSLDVVRNLERVFDAKLDSAQPQPINLMGATRGLYLPGYGLVFTAELDLTLTPTAGGLLHREITPADVAAIHQRKLAQLPVLQRLMRDMIAASARQAGTMPDNERIVVAVRLWCQAFEDRTGLPSQILMTADRKSAMSGQILEVATK
jgi:hypothetical protein